MKTKTFKRNGKINFSSYPSLPGCRESNILIITFFILCTLYAAFSTNAHLSFAQDALLYSYWIEIGSVTNINRHFLWNFLFFLIYKIWNILGFGGGALRAGQVISAIFGASGIIIFYLITEELLPRKEDIIERVLFTGFYAFSFSYWHFSGEANPQTFSNFLRLFLTLFIIRSKGNTSYKRTILLGTLSGFVFLSELLGITLIFSLMVMIYFFSDSKKIVNVILFCLSSVGVFYLFYGISTSTLLGTPLKDILLSIFSLGPKNPFAPEFPLGFLYMMKAIIFIPGIITPSMGNPEVIKLWYIFNPLCIIFYLFLFYSLLIGFVYCKTCFKEHKEIMLGLLLWFLVPFSMQFYRDPSAIDNLYYLLFPIWLFLLIVWKTLNYQWGDQTKNITRIFLMIVFIFFFYQNFAYGIFPNSQNQGYELSNYYNLINNTITHKDDVILISRSGNLELYELDYLLRYKSGLQKSTILLNGYDHTPIIKKSYFDQFRVKISTIRVSGSLYMLILPGIDLPSSGDIKMLSDCLKKEIFSTDFIYARYSIEIIESLKKIYTGYIHLENRGLECNFIKMVSPYE